MDDPTSELRPGVLAGDADAFGEVFDVCARSVYNHAFRLTGDWSAAEDVMAMTFLEAWRCRAKLVPDGGSLRHSQLLLSPTSYQVIGVRVISTGADPAVQRLDKLPRARRAAVLKQLNARAYTRGRDGRVIPWPPKGEVVTSTALVQTAEVAAPGEV